MPGIGDVTAPRVVSLLPSATEIVCALGLGEQLVGRSHECDYPPEVAGLPVCTAPRFAVEGTSREIDARVKDLARRALSLYEVDAQMLARLRPDVVITQTQCDVCAVSLDEVERSVRSLVGSAVEIVALEAKTVDGVFEDIRRVGQALDVASAAAVLIGGLSSRLTTIAERAGLADQRPSVVALEWLDPLMAAGSWIPELIEAAGGRARLGRAGEPAPWIQWRELADTDPDVIVLMPCGFDLARTCEEAAVLRAWDGWDALRAVEAGRVYATDANQYFNRPGPRLVDSAEILAAILHPEAFSFEGHAEAWRRLN